MPSEEDAFRALDAWLNRDPAAERLENQRAAERFKQAQASRHHRQDELYELLGIFAERVGGPIPFCECKAGAIPNVPGVYFVFEPDELRTLASSLGRVVRVGVSSHLRLRLRSHRGTRAGGGHHRNSAFRDLVGDALMAQSGKRMRSWRMRSLSEASTRLRQDLERIRARESVLEEAVSARLATMSVLAIPTPSMPADDLSPIQTARAIEVASLSLLSRMAGPQRDAPSANWLGRSSSRQKVRDSGLWNSDFVYPTFDSADFPSAFESVFASPR